jgi:hypothetical protein
MRPTRKRAGMERRPLEVVALKSLTRENTPAPTFAELHFDPGAINADNLAAAEQAVLEEITEHRR